MRCEVAEGYIFDMDGVLCDSEAFIAEAAIAMFKKRYQVDVTVADFEPFIGSGEDRYLGGVAEKYGIDLQVEADKAETYRLYGSCVKGKLQALAGVTAFLARVREEGIRLAVATSADAVKMRINLREMGVEEALFDALVSGLEIVHKKPAPDIFLEAASRLKLPASACVVFEDAINGVEAAKSAGAYCVGVTSSFSAAALIEAGADQTIETFYDVGELP
jgi:HAD superfamily hydrolase (TIGR01509 family)